MFTQEQAIEKIKAVYGDRYCCSKVVYKGTKKKVIITCPIHGDFAITPDHIFRGIGCPSCGGTKKLSAEEFIAKSESIHGKKYDYSNVKYINNRTKVEIICRKCGKKFMQAPFDHIQGKGCPFCSSSAGENMVASTLEKMKISFINQYRFSGCFDKRTLPFDFYLPDYNTVIEYQGVQHYKNVPVFKDGKNEIQRRDGIKRKYCIDNNIKETEISYFDDVEKKLIECLDGLRI